MMAAHLVRKLIIAMTLLLVWKLITVLTHVPVFILPPPEHVVATLMAQWIKILPHAGTTFAEILIGLLLGTVFGAGTALFLMMVPPARNWLMPVLVISQALPVFALAPLLTLWLGYGLASKIAMATLIIYFPVTAAFYDGLKRIDPGWLDLAQVMGGSRLTILTLIRIPAAIPAFGSGLRVATAVAPIGAVVGEWVGASAGLGYLMLHANARMQTDLMFASLFILALISILLYTAVDLFLQKLTKWQPEDGFA